MSTKTFDNDPVINEVAKLRSRLNMAETEFRVSTVLNDNLSNGQMSAVEELHATRERCTTTFEHAANGIALVEAETGRWMQVNPALCEMLGYSKDELLNTTYEKLTHPDDLENNAVMVNRLLAGDKSKERWDKRYIHKNGHVVWASISAALVRDFHNNPSYFISQIQDITERKLINEALRESDERMRILFEYAPDAYFLMDMEGNLIDGNRAVSKLTGTDRTDFLNKNIADIGLLSEADTVKAANEITAVGQGKPSRSVEYCILRKDGSQVPVEVSSYPVSIRGRPVILSIARDVTERKEAEASMVQMHQRLLEYSRQAGMAEVATAVLHNVGNVLNSINVSSSLVTEKIRNSHISGVARTAALLKEHEDDIGEFLSQDPKGKQVPAYLYKLSEFLADEQRELIEEIEFLGKNIEHVKEIVSMQQSYALVSGVSDLANISELVEDSLRMNIRALLRHGVETVREYEPVPPMEIEKYKVMQILVNLIHNAKYACANSPRADKQLTLRVSGNQHTVSISVTDNGIGIDPADQKQIFNYGVTTKSRGHGLGLYSGLLAAREMGGSLTVFSEGRGHGTTFTLELPRPDREDSDE